MELNKCIKFFLMKMFNGFFKQMLGQNLGWFDRWYAPIWWSKSCTSACPALHFASWRHNSQKNQCMKGMYP
jgi:hypothetical protein